MASWGSTTTWMHLFRNAKVQPPQRAELLDALDEWEYLRGNLRANESRSDSLLGQLCARLLQRQPVLVRVLLNLTRFRLGQLHCLWWW